MYDNHDDEEEQQEPQYSPITPEGEFGKLWLAILFLCMGWWGHWIYTVYKDSLNVCIIQTTGIDSAINARQLLDGLSGSEIQHM